MARCMMERVTDWNTWRTTSQVSRLLFVSRASRENRLACLGSQDSSGALASHLAGPVKELPVPSHRPIMTTTAHNTSQCGSHLTTGAYGGRHILPFPKIAVENALEMESKRQLLHVLAPLRPRNPSVSSIPRHPTLMANVPPGFAASASVVQGAVGLTNRMQPRILPKAQHKGFGLHKAHHVIRCSHFS